MKFQIRKIYLIMNTMHVFTWMAHFSDRRNHNRHDGVPENIIVSLARGDKCVPVAFTRLTTVVQAIRLLPLWYSTNSSRRFSRVALG